MNRPPPLPGTGNGFRTAAQLSWLSVVISLGVNVILAGPLQAAGAREKLLLLAGFAGLMFLTGLSCGIAALCGIPRHGAKGLLWPALTGIVLWLLLTVIAIPNFLLARHKALERRAAMAHPVELTSLARNPGAERLQDAELGFALELPPGYRAMPAASLPKVYRYGYLKPGVGEPNSVLMVKGLGGTLLPGEHLTVAQLPAGKNLTVVPFSWRGLAVDGIRVPEKADSGEYVTFNVQIPLKRQAIQISFGGPAASEALLKVRAGQVLSTLDGKIN